MDKEKIVTINGRSYDTATGMPVAQKRKTDVTLPRRGATTAHKTVERSHTLNRRLAKKNSNAVKRPQTGRTMDIARGSQITKFAPRPVAAHAGEKHAHDEPIKRPVSHPIAKRAIKRHSTATAKRDAVVATMTTKQIKDQEISAALEKGATPAEKMPGFFRRHSRRLMVTIIVLAIIVAGGYLTLTNLPVLSLSFAASQAGIKATYPGYTPDGYHLQQPISYSDGKVQLKFESNSGAGHYTITQSRSSWDSSAVLTNIVQKAAGDDYVITQDSGLTIFTYQGDAAWVNAGILYVIDNSAPLSDQIRTIATSL